MKIKNAIILPKDKTLMFNHKGKPFLFQILDYFYDAGINNVLIPITDEANIIKENIGEKYRNINIEYPLYAENDSTKLMLSYASSYFKGLPFFVFNNDKLIFGDLWEMESQFKSNEVDLIICEDSSEKSDFGTCVAGDRIYLMDDSMFLLNENNEDESFEQYLNEMSSKLNIVFIHPITDSLSLKNEENKFDLIDDLIQTIKKEKKWTLFLDRDGVINKRIPGNYVKFPDEFEFIKGSDIAIKEFSNYFENIIVVTNQQGVGKKIMNIERINDVHEFMIEGVEKVGGKIDKVYYCPELAKLNPKCRKPNIGMGLEAKIDFPGIDFSKSVMVGDSISDIQFGNRLNMKTVFVETKNKEEIELAKKENIDFQFKDLFSFAGCFNSF